MISQLPISWYRDEMEITFQFIVKCGFITKPLLAELFKIQSRWSLARLSHAIDRSKYFEAISVSPEFYAWRLSRSGKYEARSRGLKPSFPPRISSRAHDEMALSIAIRLERDGFVADWMPESYFIIQPSNRLMVSQDSRGQKYPDLVLSLSIQNQIRRIAVELELSRKSLSRYEKALTGYKAVRGIDAVIFIVGSKAVRTSIEAAIRRTRFDQNKLPILFAEKNQFQQSPCDTRLERADATGTFQNLVSIFRTGGQNAA